MVVSERVQVRDLRTALEEIEAAGELVRIERPVENGLELATVARNSAFQPKAPALLFENIKGYPGWRVATAVNADRGRIHRLFNLPPGTLAAKERLIEMVDSPLPPRIVPTGPCKENIVTKNIDLPSLIPWTHGARNVTHRYITAPIITKDPFTGKQNLGMYRTCIQGPDTVTVNGRWDRHMGFQLQDAQRSKIRFPVAIVVGPDPAMVPVAASKLPYGADDFGVLGSIRGEPVDLVQAETQDLLVPANAEAIIEGYIQFPYERGSDGPWPEYLSYLGMNIHPPLVHVTAVTFRNNPINYVIVPRGSGDNSGIVNSALFLRHLRQFASTFVVDCHLVPASAMHHSVIAVRKADPHHEGLQFNVALSAFGFLNEMDRVTLVDDDVDIYDMEYVEWAVATRCDPAEQVHILGPGRSHQNNPIAGVHEMFDEPLTKHKMVIDATIPWRFRTAEKAPGLTFFSRSEWDALDLTEYFKPEDVRRWVRRRAEGTLYAQMFNAHAKYAELPGSM